MRFLMIAITILTSLFLPFSAAAQAPQQFSKVNVAIWPEYDRPQALIIYRVTLASDASLPAPVTFSIPLSAGRPNAVAMEDVDGSLVNLNYTTAQDGQWLRLSFTTPVPDFQVEYYDPGLIIEGSTRSYEYNWPGDHGVGTMSVQVQEPVGAGGMQITPNLGAGREGQDGLVYYNTVVGELKAGTTFKIRLSYQKSDASLSVNSQPVEPEQPITEDTPGRLTVQEVVPWMVAGLGVLLLAGGGLLWYWQVRRVVEADEPRKRHAGQQTQDAAPGDSSIYCHQCGKRAANGDVFCRACGTRLRL